MEYYGNTLCISARELVDGGIMTASNYKQLSARKRINVVRSGKGKDVMLWLPLIAFLLSTAKWWMNFILVVTL